MLLQKMLSLHFGVTANQGVEQEIPNTLRLLLIKSKIEKVSILQYDCWLNAKQKNHNMEWLLILST